VITTFTDRGERSRVTGERGLRRLLRRTGLDEAAVVDALEEVAHGRTIVLVDIADSIDNTEAQVERMARAA
jgi:cobalamin-dependent methionine synthase I